MTNEIINNTLSGAAKYGANYDMGNSASVQDIALAVGLESMNTYDDMVTSYYAMVHKENIEMQNLNNAMAAANAHDTSYLYKCTFDYTDPDTGETSTKKLSDFMSQQDIAHDTDDYNYDTVVSNIKSELDSVSSMSQVDMMKLQSILNKQQQAQSAASSIMKKADDANMDNIRKW